MAKNDNEKKDINSGYNTIDWDWADVYLEKLEKRIDRELKSGTDSTSKAKPMPEPKTAPEPEPLTVTARATQRRAEPEPELKPEPESEPEPEPKPELKTEPRTRPISKHEKTTHAPMQPARRRRRFRFYKILLLIVLVMFLGIGIGTYYLWQYVEAYELSRHEHIIHFLQNNIDHAFWEKHVRNALIPLLTEFEQDADNALAPHLHRIWDVQYSLRQKSDESTDEAPVYIIRAGSRDIGILRLAPFGDAGYGFSLWDVESMEFLDSFIDPFPASITVTASQNAHVEVNGVPVSSDYRIECEFENGATYQINGLFGEVGVSVYEADGQISAPYFYEGGIFLFPIIHPFSRSYKISVPDGSTVFFNGETVSSENITLSGIVPEVFQGEVDIADFLFTELWYEFEADGLYQEPVITAEDRFGNELAHRVSDDGEIIFVIPYSQDLKQQHETTAESFIRAYISYGANVGNDIDVNFANVSSLLLRSSDLFRRAQGARTAMQYTSNVTIEYNSLEIDNFRAYGETYFTCEISYNITHRTRYQQSEVEGNFEVLFVLSGGRWLAAKMVVI